MHIFHVNCCRAPLLQTTLLIEVGVGGLLVGLCIGVVVAFKKVLGHCCYKVLQRSNELCEGPSHAARGVVGGG
jgi:uncharacterized metal-binding protein